MEISQVKRFLIILEAYTDPKQIQYGKEAATIKRLLASHTPYELIAAVNQTKNFRSYTSIAKKFKQDKTLAEDRERGREALAQFYALHQ